MGLQRQGGKGHLNGKPWKYRSRTFGILLFGIVLASAARLPLAANPALSEATREKILRYIHERFGVADATKLTVGEVRDSFAPNFFQVSIVSDDPKDPKGKHDQPAWVSKDSRYLLLGNLFEVSDASSAEMIRRVREAFKVPENVKLTLGSFHASHVADFQTTTLTIDNGKGPQERKVLLASDGKHAILGDIYPLDVDLQKQALHGLTVGNSPTQGPANAPVTIFEFADLQCPTCALLHQFLETQLLPRYGNKVRVVFKEFPLVGIHDWSPTAAVACQCAYEMNPSTFVPIRTAIFRSQQSINITNVRDTLLNFGEQAGLDRVKLSACIDAKSTWPRIEADLAEGKKLNVASTPTSFINGRMLVGIGSQDGYLQTVDEALRAAQ